MSKSKWNKPSSALSLGQSNGSIEVFEDVNGVARVRKTATAEPKRLEAQYLKHVNAELGSMQPLGVPEVISKFINSSYEMEYVQGTPLGILLETASHEEVQELSLPIVSYLESGICEDLPQQESFESDLRKKLSDLLNVHGGEKFVQKDPLHQILDRICTDFMDAPKLPAWNHGDFSMDNLLVSPNNETIYALDFLDSPVETRLIDWGRIWLDTKYGWWGAGYWPSSNWKLNSRHLAFEVERGAQRVGLEEHHLDASAAFAILRIMPYTKRPVRMSLLKSALNQISRKNQR